MPLQKKTEKKNKKHKLKNEAATIIQRKLKKTQKKISSEILSPTIHILEEENICKDYKKFFKRKAF